MFDREPDEQQRSVLEQRDFDQKLIFGMGLGLTAVTLLTLQFGGEALRAIATWEGPELTEGANFGLGDTLGAMLWTLALYYASPWQLLLLFIGKMDTERPSDWVIRSLGRAAGLSVDAIDYTAPAWIRAGTVAIFAGAGFATAATLGSLLGGDASWSVSTGMGACVAAGMYEVGRPQRLSVEEAQVLESQWKDFERYASEKLQRSGRCHESEVIRGFRRSFARYRQPSAISDATIRDMVRNWHPKAERTGRGFYKNLSLLPPEAVAARQQEQAAREAAAAAAGSGDVAALTPAGSGSGGGSSAGASQA